MSFIREIPGNATRFRERRAIREVLRMSARILISQREQSVKRLAINAMGLLIMIPATVVLYLFREHLEGKWLPLVFLLITSGLGFFLLWRITNAIAEIAKGLESVSKGAADSIGEVKGPSQLNEMAEIINALNKLTSDFKANARQLETLIQQFSTLTELTEMTARIPDIGELLSLVLRKAMGATHSGKGSIMLVREDGDGLDIVAADGWTPSVKGPIALHDSVAGKVIESGEPLLVTDLDSDPGWDRKNDTQRYTSSSFLIMPLKAKTAIIGVLCLSEKVSPTPFTDQDRQFLTVLLGQIGFAVENARLLQQARRAAEALRQVVEHKDVELKDAHNQIVQAEKLSALGQLIAGVAHEMNNPLTSVVGYAGLVLETSDRNTEKVERRLKTILGEANRATKIVQNLLTFARARKSEKRSTDLNEIVGNIVALRQYDLKTQNIEFATDLDPKLPPTSVDADQLQQVLLNFVNNAAQAMKPEGVRRITIGSERVEGSIHLWVADTGQGITDGVRKRIFEPFFSTKGTKTNTGLGLSISYGIVKEHGGDIRVESVEGEGTRMTVILPVLETLVEPSEGSGREASRFPQVEDKTALIVDDEPNIAELVEEILGSVGFEVEVLTRGRDALERLTEKYFDLVICDIRMPDLSGQEVYRTVRERRPDMADKFIMISGDIADPQARLFSNQHQIKLVAKPFGKKQLLEGVFEVIEGLVPHPVPSSTG
jgi:signal transduction histidine kinase